MKQILVLLSLFSCMHVIAQKSQVITDSSKSMAEMFGRAVTWIANTWGSADNLVSTRDETTGVLLVKAGLKAAPQSEGYAVKGLTLTELTIQCDNGSARLTFAHTVFRWDAGTTWSFEDTGKGEQLDKWKADVSSEMDGIFASFKASLQ